jgi:hypothetical protein
MSTSQQDLSSKKCSWESFKVKEKDGNELHEHIWKYKAYYKSKNTIKFRVLEYSNSGVWITYIFSYVD